MYIMEPSLLIWKTEKIGFFCKSHKDIAELDPMHADLNQTSTFCRCIEKPKRHETQKKYFPCYILNLFLKILELFVEGFDAGRWSERIVPERDQ